MKNLGKMLKMRRVLLFRTQLHFSSVFSHFSRQFTALETVGLFQLSKRLTFKDIIFWQDLCKSRASHVRNLLPASITREAAKNLSPWFVPVNLAITSHTLLCQWTLGSAFGIPHTGLPTGVNGGGQGRVWGPLQGGRETVEGGTAAQSGLEGMSELG